MSAAKTVAPLGAAALALGLLLSAQAATAGPLRDLILERRAAQAQSEALEDDDPAPAVLPADIRILRDVAYGPDRRQAMDIYLPQHARHAPVILMVHGGGWRYGDKLSRTVTGNKAAHWVRRGFVFVSANYRLLPEADPLTQAADVARALAYAQAHAAEWGGDAAKVILMGHSAGAHLVALLAADPARARALGAKPWPGTIALDSAALDVARIMAARHLPLYDRAFGRDKAYWRRASPFHALSAGATPLLAVCSKRRADSCPQAAGFAARAKSRGLRAGVLEQNLSHRQINDELGLPGGYTEAVEAFVDSLVGAGRSAPGDR